MICRAAPFLFVIGIATASAQSSGPVPDVPVRSFEVASINKQSPLPTAGVTATAIGQTTPECV